MLWQRNSPVYTSPSSLPHLALSCSAEGFAHMCGHAALHGQALSTSSENSHSCSTTWPQGCMCLLPSCCKTDEGKSGAVGNCLAGRDTGVNGLEGGRADSGWACAHNYRRHSRMSFLGRVSPRAGACVMPECWTPCAKIFLNVFFWFFMRTYKWFKEDFGLPPHSPGQNG